MSKGSRTSTLVLPALLLLGFPLSAGAQDSDPASRAGQSWKGKVRDALIEYATTGDGKQIQAVWSDMRKHFEETTVMLGELHRKPPSEIDSEDARKRLDNLRKRWVIVVVDIGSSTGAVYAGQYEILRSLGDDAKDLLLDLVENSPPNLLDAMRALILSALRDVAKKLPEKAMELLGEIADDEFEDSDVQKMATFVLAFYGDRARVEKALAGLEKMTREGTDAQRLRAWGDLATLHYQIRDYRSAVTSYQELIGLGPPEGQLPTILYNLACSQSLSGDIDGAFVNLDKALGEPGSDRLSDTLLKTDHDIAALRKDERFVKILLKHGRKWVKDLKRAASRPADRK